MVRSPPRFGFYSLFLHSAWEHPLGCAASCPTQSVVVSIPRRAWHENLREHGKSSTDVGLLIVSQE